MPHIIVSRTRPFMPSLNVPGLSLNFLPTDSGTMKSETSFCVQSLLCLVTFIMPFIMPRIIGRIMPAIIGLA